MLMEADVTNLYATLDGMDLDQLRQVKKRVERMISDYQDRKRQEAIAAAEQVVKEHGFKLTELLGNGKSGRVGKTAVSKSSEAAKYMNPDDPQQTWSGRGRRPSWVRAALDSGRSLDDLAM